MTVVVSFQKFADWVNDVPVYPKNFDDTPLEVIAQIISDPVVVNGEIDLGSISAFDRCPSDCAIFVYETEIAAATFIQHEDVFYACKDELRLVYGTEISFPG